jgi:uncharacterized protein YlxW (UPF0749 family)
MANDKAKKDTLTHRVSQTQKQIDHLNAEISKVQAMIDDPNNTNDAELEVLLNDAVNSLNSQIAKMAKLTGTTVPVI